MSKRRLSRARPICLAISLSGLLCGVADAASVRHAEPLLGLSIGAHKPTAAGPTVISFNAFSRDFALELEPNGRLAGLQQRTGTAVAYRGKIAGRSDSWVRLVLTPEGPSGLVFDGETLYGVEAGDDTTLAGGAPAMFRLADVYFAPGELGCEIGAAALDGEQVVAAMAQEFAALAAVAATRRLDLGAVADFEFSQAFGANAESELLTRFNNVDGIFSEQLGVEISVEKVDIFTVSDDPFTASTANALLDELASYRGRTPSQEALGLTHLFTGRDLDGATAGIAFIGAVCATRRPPEPRSFGAGLSEGRRGAVLDSLLAAHEIGHNFGAPHDGAAACASTPSTGFLMAPNVIGSDRFSACSIEQMQAEIASASATCLTRIGPADMRVRLPQPTQVFAGVSFPQVANIDNDGADEATGVVFTATAPSGLAIEAAASAGATCTVLPSSASCPLGAVGGGATRSVTLTLRAPAPGTFNLTAAVSAASDQNPGNNTVALALTAVPSVDLVWSGAASPVQLNAQATVTATLANAADFAATAVTVTATMAVGLRADQATLGGSACTISTPTTVSCQPQTLAARASVPLVLTVTAMAAGSQQLTLNATANELERAQADNRLPLAINVSAPPSGGGGGGSIPWLAVAALLAAHGWRRTMRGRRRPF